MSHEVDTMASSNDIVPWHKLGTVIKGMANADEMVKAAKLDWEVKTEPVFDSDMRVIPNFQRVFRVDTNRTFNILGPNYSPLQNRRLAELVEPVVANEQYPSVFETAGSLFSGELVWFLLQTKGFKLKNDEEHKMYIMFSMGHGGRRAVTATLTNVRVVCNNTFTMAVREGDKLFKKKHTKNVEANVIDALGVLAAVQNKSEEFALIANKLLDVSVTDDNLIKLTRSLLKDNDSKQSEGVFSDILAYTKYGPGSNGGKNLWDWFNGVTFYADHVKGVRVKDTGVSEDEAKAFSIVFGGAATLKEDAYSIARNFASV